VRKNQEESFIFTLAFIKKSHTMPKTYVHKKNHSHCEI